MIDNAEDFKLEQVVSIIKKLDPSFQDYMINDIILWG
jgi:hypothetical protein